MYAYCLADFFNLELLPNGRRPNLADVRFAIEELTSNTLEAIKGVGSSPAEVTIRLYGGWYDAHTGRETPIKQQAAAVVRDFPKRLGTRIRMQIAESLLARPHLKFEDTLRLVPFRADATEVVEPPTCVLGENCSIHGLPSWVQGKCPEVDCQVQTADLFITKRQKITDTLLTADALHLATESEIDLIVVASDDDDFLPALLGANGLGKLVLNMFRRDPAKFRYKEMVEYDGVYTYRW